MIARNHNYWFQRAALNPVPPAHRLKERLLNYFDQHPQVSREGFLLAAIHKEMEFRAADTILRTWPENARPHDRGPRRWDHVGWPQTAEDTHIHVWLAERLVSVDRQRHSWREKLRRILS